MQANLFYGSGTALVTPFHGNRIDFDALEKLIDRQIDSNTDALILLGTTGEPASISDSERSAMIECAVARCAGRVPLYVGSGCNDTKKTIVYSTEAMRLGADGLLLVTPYYNKTSSKGLIEHFYAVADSVNIPIILYNVPSRTGLNLPPEILPELAKHPMICGLKEACSDISHAMRLFEAAGDALAIYCGNDDLVLPMMSLGARGVISVVANILPEQMHALSMAYLRGDISACKALQFHLLPLMRQLFCEVNPIPIKAAMEMLGLCEGTLRLPLAPLDETEKSALRRELVRMRLLED